MTDGTNILNGDTDCFPADTTIAKTFNVGGFATIVLHLKCNDVTSALTIAVTKSTDGNSFMAINTSVDNLDNNEQWVVLTEAGADGGASIIKVSIVNGMAEEDATVLAVVGMKA